MSRTFSRSRSHDMERQAEMTRFLCSGIVAILIAACGVAPGGGSPPAGNASSGGGKASIDLTVSGALQGTSTQLVKYDCAGGQFGSFIVDLDPVMNGKQYKIGLGIGRYKGAPVTIARPDPDNNVTVQCGNDQSGIWSNDSNTTGSVTI